MSCLEAVCWCHDPAAWTHRAAATCGHCGCKVPAAYDNRWPIRLRANKLTREYQAARAAVGLPALMGDELADLYLLAMEAARSGR